MNRFILLLVLITGVLSGYLIGDYRGKDARETLKRAVKTGKILDTEREASIARLKTELGGITDKHRQELAAIRKSNDTKIAEWRRVKAGLDDKLKYASAKLAISDKQLIALVARRDVASGTDKDKLDQEIANLRKERNELLREIEGNACLKARVPHSVFEALNETHSAGG